MSELSPEPYESGRGMDAHNRVMREIRDRRNETYDPEEPTRVWLDTDNTPDGVLDSLTIILNTGGCRWARAGGCTMCGYVAESVEGGQVTDGQLRSQLENCLDYERHHSESKAPLVKIYTSGSFLDDREISPQMRTEIAELFSNRERIVIESLPDFVEQEKLAPFINQGLATDVAIGLETATDRIRHDCINKYFTFSAFEQAAAEASEIGGGIKAYLLLKPPFLSEPEAITDMIQSISRCADVGGCHTVSMNPCTVHRYTLVEQIFREGGFRPPWLWSVAHILHETSAEELLVVSDPVGFGSNRGPHNCGECDELVNRAIKDFSLRQDPSVFDEVSCSCQQIWEYVCQNETGYNQPLVS